MRVAESFTCTGMTPLITYQRHHKRCPQPTEGELAGSVTEREDEPVPRNS